MICRRGRPFDVLSFSSIIPKAQRRVDPTRYARDDLQERNHERNQLSARIPHDVKITSLLVGSASPPLVPQLFSMRSLDWYRWLLSGSEGASVGERVILV